MSNLRIREHLTSIRDGMKKVCLMTQGLGAEPKQEDLENTLFMREAVMTTEVDRRAKELAAAFPDWHVRAKNDAGLSKLLGEAEDLMHSILLMDEDLSKALRRRMSDIETKLTSLYQTSRAACSYTAQSKLRVSR